MIKKLLVLRSPFLALVLICSLVVSILAPVPRGSEPANGNVSYVRLLNATSSAASLILKKSVAGDTHIKVRFMGGDCGYSALFWIEARTARYNELLAAGNPVSYLLARAHFSFKLRGPPVLQVALC